MSRTCVRGSNRRELFQTVDLMVRIQAGEFTFRQQSRSIGIVWEIETTASRREMMQPKWQLEKTPWYTQMAYPKQRNNYDSWRHVSGKWHAPKFQEIRSCRQRPRLLQSVRTLGGKCCAGCQRSTPSSKVRPDLKRRKLYLRYFQDKLIYRRASFE